MLPEDQHGDETSGTGEKSNKPKRHRTPLQKWRLVSLPNKIIAIATVVIAGSNFLYTVVALHTLSEIRSGSKDTHTLAEAAKRQADKAEIISTNVQRAADQMERSANQAEITAGQSAVQSKTALEATIAQNQLDQRAWVGVKGVSLTPLAIEKPVTAEVTLVNTGKTHAQAAAISLHMNSETKRVTQLSVRGFNDPEKSITTIFPQQQLSASVTMKNSIGEPIKPADDDIAAYKARSIIIYIWGEINYQDIFRKTHTTHFCFYFAGEEQHGVACEMYNQAN
jgi:hypothetical protein